MDESVEPNEHPPDFYRLFHVGHEIGCQDSKQPKSKCSFSIQISVGLSRIFQSLRQHVCKFLFLIQDSLVLEVHFPLKKHWSNQVKDVMDELFQSEMLKAILCGQFGDYGMSLGSELWEFITGTRYHELLDFCMFFWHCFCYKFSEFCSGDSPQVFVLWD